MKIINIKDARDGKDANVKKRKQYKEPESDVLDYLKAEFDLTLAAVQKNNKGEGKNGITK